MTTISRVGPLFILMLMALLIHTDKLSAQAAELPNCDFTSGAVDIDNCPEIRQKLERDEIAALNPCNRGSAVDFEECARKANKKADAELNRVYQKLMALLPDGDSAKGLTRSQLREDELKWVRWKESYCAAHGEKTGGASTWKSAYTVECWARATEDQTRKLKRLLKSASNSKSIK